MSVGWAQKKRYQVTKNKANQPTASTVPSLLLTVSDGWGLGRAASGSVVSACST